MGKKAYIYRFGQLVDFGGGVNGTDKLVVFIHVLSSYVS